MKNENNTITAAIVDAANAIVDAPKAAAPKAAAKAAPKKAAPKAPAKKAAAKAPAKKAGGTVKPVTLNTETIEGVKCYVYYSTESGTPYRLLAANRAYFSAYTIAVLEATGCIRVHAKGLITALKGGRVDHALATMGKSASSYWQRMGFADKAARTISVKGINNLQARLNGEGQYSTTVQVLDEVRKLVKESGTLQIKGESPITFKSKNAIMA